MLIVRYFYVNKDENNCKEKKNCIWFYFCVFNILLVFVFFCVFLRMINMMDVMRNVVFDMIKIIVMGI